SQHGVAGRQLGRRRQPDVRDGAGCAPALGSWRKASRLDGECDNPVRRGLGLNLPGRGAAKDAPKAGQGKGHAMQDAGVALLFA
ncbi:MAG: hypothetical protein WCK17_13855, partial [Verrucomicrobiota bacterium]